MGDAVNKHGLPTLRDLAARLSVKPVYKIRYKVSLDASSNTLQFSIQQICEGAKLNWLLAFYRFTSITVSETSVSSSASLELATLCTDLQ